MKTGKIFCFEFGYLMSRLSTRLYFAVLLLFTITMNLLTTPGDGVYANNTFHITAMTVIGGLIWLIMGASIAGEAAARDVRTRMHHLVFTTPVSKLDYLGGRFLAALTVNALLILCLPLGVMLSFYLPAMDQEELLPFRPWAYLNVYFLIALPTVFVATALQFSLAVLTRQVMTSYMVSLLLAIVTQLVAIAVANFFGNWDLVKLLDPIGIAGIINSELATWTPTEKNTRLITFNGMFFWNRVLWSIIASLTLAVTYIRYRPFYPENRPWWDRFAQRNFVKTKRDATTKSLNVAALQFPQIRRESTFATYIRQATRIAWVSFCKIATHPLGFTMVGIVAIISVVFSDQIMTQLSIPLIPKTQQLITYLANPVSNLGSPWVIIPLLLIYFTGLLTWQDRDAGISDIADASPVADWVLLTGKFLGIALVLFAWLTLMMATGIGMQLSMNYYETDIKLYLQALFGIQFIEYSLFALLALAVHVIVNQKYISYLVILLIYIFIAFPSTFQTGHKLLIFGAAPAWSYTDMRGFGSSLAPWLWFKFYWMSWGLLLAVVARLFWVRGREQHLKHRLQSVTARATRLTKSVTLVAMVLIVSIASFIFYNTNILNEYQNSNVITEVKAEYERRYGRYRNISQPQLTATKLAADIYPERQQIKIIAAYTLINRDTVPIDSIHLGSLSGIMPVDLKFNRKATAVLIDNKHSYLIYALKQPLQPGDSLQLNFAIHYEEKGFSNNGKNGLVVKNGTYFTNFDLLPSIGYQSYRELNDAVTRKKHQLLARPAIPSLYDKQAGNKPVLTDRNTFEAIVGTAKDEVAVGPGRLLKSWTAGNRRYFHFKTDAPIRGEYAILSSNFAVREAAWNNVAIRMYYHPGHNTNIEGALQSVKASMAYYTEQFGPYPFRHLTITERPGADGGASSEATMIDYGEQFALLNPDKGPDGFNLPFYIIAHEVAHQWWGGASLAPANVEGAGVLIEGLAVYAGLLVLEKNYGDNHLRKYLRFLHDFYEMPRSLATPPLLQANEAFLYYRKSGLAMYALSRYIGREKLNGALRILLEKHHAGQLKFPTTLDLYREIKQVTPDSLHLVLDDLFKKNTYWRLKTEKLTASQNKAGNWEVSINVQAHKMIIDRTGKENEVPMNDLLEVGLYAKDDGQGKPLYLQLHRIKSGNQIINITLPHKPASGGIDPNFLKIDLRIDDNIMQTNR